MRQGKEDVIKCFFKKIFFVLIYLFLVVWVCVAVSVLSLVAASGGLFFIAELGLLTAVASLVAEHGLSSMLD